MAAEDLRRNIVRPFSEQPKTYWLEQLFPESKSASLGSSARTSVRQNEPTVATYRPTGAWWGKLPDETYYCLAHNRSLETIPSTGESASGVFTGQKLACPVCGNWMFDLHLQDN